MKYKHIDFEYAKSILDYNPETGLFTRTVQTSNLAKVGYIAGSVDRDGYIIINIRNNPFKAHRIAWAIYYGKQPVQIDHINGIKDDNRISNLRECTASQNGANKASLRNNTSGYKGVHWHKSSGKWRAKIRAYGKNLEIGHYSNIEDAAKVYADAAIKYHGEFARIN